MQCQRHPCPDPVAAPPTTPHYQAEAQAAKEAGNALYKQKKFEEAIAQYNKAMELDPSDVSFISNRAAVYFEMARCAGWGAGAGLGCGLADWG